MPTSDLNGLVTAATSQTHNLEQTNLKLHRIIILYAHALMKTAESLVTALVCHKPLQTAPETIITAYLAISALRRLLTNAAILVIYNT